MTQFQDIRPGSVAIPKAQTIIKAAHLSNTKEDADSWPVVGGVKSKDGWALCDGSTYDPLVFPDLDKNLGFPASKVLPNGPYRTREIDLSLSNTPSGWTLTRAKAFFESDDENNWYINLFIIANADSFIQETVEIDQISWDVEASPFATTESSTANGSFAITLGTNEIRMTHSASNVAFICQGRAKLAAKPTIANFDDFLESYPIIAVNDNVTSSSIGLPEIGAEQPGLPTLDQIAEGNRNYIINGGFDFWQRGTSQTDNGYSSADRFFFSYGTTTKTISQQSFSAGQTEVGSNPKYYTESAIASGNTASSYGQSFQKIEGVDTLQGDIVTLSFYAKADTSKNMSTEFVQGFGTGGSPSADVFGIGVKKYALTTSWQKFTVTTTIPSIAGKTLGTNGDDYLRVNFWLDAGTDYDLRTDSLGNQSGTFDIAQVKLEQGTEATKFTRAGVTYAGELALCQRYYEKSIALQETPGTVQANNLIYGQAFSFTSSHAIVCQPFKVVKRSNPTIVIYSRQGEAGKCTQDSNANDHGTASVGNSDDKMLYTISTSATITDAVRFYWTADSEL